MNTPTNALHAAEEIPITYRPAAPTQLSTVMWSSEIVKIVQKSKLGDLVQTSFNPLKGVERVDFSIDSDSLLAYNCKLNLEELTQLIKLFQRALCDPKEVIRHLRPLNHAIGESLNRREIHHKSIPRSDYLIACEGYFLPGAPPASYVPHRKGRILNDVFLSRQYAWGLNPEEILATFNGPISKDEANQFVQSGHLFKENTQVNRMLIHGKYVHCFGFEILWGALQESSFADKINAHELLTILIETHVFHFKGYSQAWNFLIDNVRDLGNASAPETFAYSGGCPILLQSLLLCFGEQISLPHIQTCLLENHWKATYRMIRKINAQSDLPGFDVELNQKLYFAIMEALSTGRSNISSDYAFAWEVTRSGNTYDRLSLYYDSRIKQKAYSSKFPGKYLSMEDYMTKCDTRHWWISEGLKWLLGW